MVVTTNPTNTGCLKAGNITIEKISEFKYLGTLITSNNVSTEIHHKLQLTDRCHLGLRKQLQLTTTELTLNCI